MKCRKCELRIFVVVGQQEAFGFAPLFRIRAGRVVNRSFGEHLRGGILTYYNAIRGQSRIYNPLFGQIGRLHRIAFSLLCRGCWTCGVLYNSHHPYLANCSMPRSYKYMNYFIRKSKSHEERRSTKFCTRTSRFPAARCNRGIPSFGRTHRSDRAGSMHR